VALRDRPRTELSLGIRAVGYLLCGLGALSDVCVGLLLLMTFTLPGVSRPTLSGSILLVVLSALASAPLVFGVAILTRRRWALIAADGSLVAFALASLLVLVAVGGGSAGVAAVSLPILLISLGGADYLRRPSVRTAYRAVAGQPPHPPASVLRVALRLAPPTRVLGGLGLIGLAAVAEFAVLTIRPVDSSAMAEVGADIFRALLESLVLMWLGCGVLTLWLRRSAIPAVVGALLTLPLAGWLAGGSPTWVALVPGSVGLMLAASAALQVVAALREEVPASGLS
jgi:hypothetical protein